MSLSSKKRPSPALIVTAIALVFAMVGTSVAQDPVGKITGNKVRKIANQEIDKRAPNLSVLKAKTADSATTANHATTAANATTAVNATNAVNAENVGGIQPKTFSVSSTLAESGAPVVSAGDLSLEYDCTAGGLNVDLSAKTTTDNARISVLNVTEGNLALFNVDEDFDAAETFDATPGGVDEGEGQLTYHSATNSIVNVDFRTSQAGADGCVVEGIITSG